MIFESYTGQLCQLNPCLPPYSMVEHSKITTFVDISMSRSIKQYNIYQLFTHVKLGSNIAINKVLQVYVTTTMIFYAISSQKVRTSHSLKQEYGSILIAKFHIYCQWIHNDLFQYLIELKNMLKIENYICTSNSSKRKFGNICVLYEQLENVN